MGVANKTIHISVNADGGFSRLAPYTKTPNAIDDVTEVLAKGEAVLHNEADAARVHLLLCFQHMGLFLEETTVVKTKSGQSEVIERLHSE